MSSVLDSAPVRVGFVTQLLFERYGAFWRALVEGAGAEVALPERDTVSLRLEEIEPEHAPGLAFRLAAAQAASLRECDLLVVPQLVPESDGERGSAQDRWVADLPGALGDAVAGLPPLVAAPAFHDASLESRSIALLQSLLHDPAAVSRVWSRVRSGARRVGQAPPRRAVPVSAHGSVAAGVALVGQPWLMTEQVLSVAAAAGVGGPVQAGLDPELVRREGWASDERLVPTDAEVIGAARVLARRAGVSELRVVVDGALSDGWLLRRVAQVVHTPVTALTLEGLLPEGAGPATLLSLPVD